MPSTVTATAISHKNNSSPQTPPSSSHPVNHPDISRQTSTSSDKGKPGNGKSPSRQSTLNSSTRSSPDTDDANWGSNFWVTLVDPQTQTSFFACPATGQVSWDPPVGTFVLPPSEEGEWWELTDESRGGLPYYYQTKTGETVWERPEGFVIPLGILQNTAAGRRLSQTTFDHFSKLIPLSNNKNSSKENYRLSAQAKGNLRPAIRRTASGEQSSNTYTSPSKRHTSAQLSPIPASPNVTDGSSPPSISSKLSQQSNKDNEDGNAARLQVPNDREPKSHNGDQPNNTQSSDSPPRSKSKQSYTSHRSPAPQSLDAALEKLSTSPSAQSTSSKISIQTSNPDHFHGSTSSSEEMPPTPSRRSTKDIPPSPTRPIPSPPTNRPTVGGKLISSPILNPAATIQMSPVKNRSNGRAIPVEPPPRMVSSPSVATLQSGTYPILPTALAQDIQHFSESEYAKQYFSTHRRGFIFRRRVPVAQLMTWQKAPLASPLLVLNKALHKDAVKIFKVIQHIMGDREAERTVNVRLAPDTHVSLVNSVNVSTASLPAAATNILVEERWLIGEGLKYGELRDEIYCQLMKQLTGNPNRDSVFKGWQLFCVLLVSFPPSKNFETYLRAFIQSNTTQPEGRVDIISKHCLLRLTAISKKGPRGKPPSIEEIETASDAAFNPSTFGENLGAIMRLQERTYPHQKVPIVLPFLADGILALGGLKAEGIFRVPGDNDSVSSLKLRIDRGYYTLENVDDPHVLASLIKLWLRELCDPLVPEELYNECVEQAKNPEACMQIVERLPTINRRVVLFVISFLQLFLEERVQRVTKMTPANLALVMAPNLLRCNSDSMSVVFTNAQYEQIFVYNLLVYMQCDDIDPDYVPAHGLGAVQDVPVPKKARNKSRPRRHE